MTRQWAMGLMLLAWGTLLLSTALGAAGEDNWYHRLTSPGWGPVLRCRFMEAVDSRATFQVLRVIYGEYRRDTVELDIASVPGRAPRAGEVVLYLAEADRREGQPFPCRGYVWENVDADEKEAARVICAGENMAPAYYDPDTLIVYLMNHAPNLIVRAALVSTDDKASYWKVVRTLLPRPSAPARSAEALRSLGYLNSPKPPFPPPSAASIPAAGERIVVRLDAWRCRAKAMVRYSNPDKPSQASAEGIAVKLKEIASKELSPGREAILLLTDSGLLDDMPAYDAIVVIPPPSSTQGEIEEAERALFEAIDHNARLKPL